MQYRTLGNTGIMISEIGYGAWGIGGTNLWGGARDEESLAALNAAIDAGINLIDTALIYGNGHSEALVGKVARAHRERIFVATKIPPLSTRFPTRWVRAKQAFPADHIVTCTENSLRNLKLDRIDLQQLHIWRDKWLTDDDDWIEALRKMKEAGKIRWIGVSLPNHEPDLGLRLVKTGLIDSVQVIYNIFDQSPAETLFPACLKHKVGVLVRSPFDEGGLTGAITAHTSFPTGDFRDSYFGGNRRTQLVARVNSLSNLLDDETCTLPELALRFCLANPAVSTVLAGMRTQQHVVNNCMVSDGRALRADILHNLKAHTWPRNFYDSFPVAFVSKFERLVKTIFATRDET
jgi:aryl-alcohol dehydrogenase-like predicted oxidoreductase